jgi:hypothetical protein
MLVFFKYFRISYMIRWTEELTCGMLDVAAELEAVAWPQSGCSSELNVGRRLLNARKLKLLAVLLENPVCQHFQGVRSYFQCQICKYFCKISRNYIFKFQKQQKILMHILFFQ